MNRTYLKHYLYLVLISIFTLPIDYNPVVAEEVNRRSALLPGFARSLLAPTATSNISSRPKISISARDLLAQNEITEVTEIQLNLTDKGLEIILETSAGGQLVPLILPEGNNLVVDLLDATLEESTLIH